MNARSHSSVPVERQGQRGQALVLMGFLLVALLSAAALVIDIGHLYYSYQELMAATTAAAMAGGSNIPNGTGISSAYKYSGDPSAPASATYNINSNLDITGVTPTLGCISTTTYSTLGLPPCIAYGTQAAANAIQVTETAKVPTFFAKIFGVPSVAITATATAIAKGGQQKPYNIMMVLDTTNSMATSTDTSCTVPGVSGSPSAEACAQYGVQQLMLELDPCSTTLTSCGTATNGLYSKSVDEVGLMVFPGLCSSTSSGVTTANCPTATSLTNTIANSTYAPNDYSCPTTAPPIAAYNNNPEYLILGLQSDYRTSDTASALNGGATGGSKIVNSVGAGVGTCSGVTAPGGEGTFYAGAIAAAQAYLVANSRANTQNVIILLSDGDANASTTQMGGTATSYTSTAQCTQAGTAATNAKNAGILFYSVSYGSEVTGCSSGESSGYTTPCLTMENMASTPTSQYFFSVPQTVNGVSSTVCSGARSDTSVDQVFTDIAGDLTTSRRIPNGTYAGAF